MRPQFGSLPCAAALTRLLETTARATARASASSAAPRHRGRDEDRGALAVGCLLAGQVARDRLERAAERHRRRDCRRRAVRWPRHPDARTKTVSLVLVSPSTDSWSHVRAAAGRRTLHRTSGATAASVSTTDSIVAMFGWIIPTPLAMPVIVTVTGSPSARRQHERRRAPTLATESVVRSASAAASRPASSPRSAATRPPTPASTRSSGSRVPMMPVERWRTWLVRRCRTRRHEPADGVLVGVARRAGRRVGAAAGRDDRRGEAEPAARVVGRGREVGPRQPHGCGRERVRREDGGRGRGTARRHDRARGPAGPTP